MFSSIDFFLLCFYFSHNLLIQQPTYQLKDKNQTVFQQKGINRITSDIISQIKIKMNNKFYDQYKSLFTEPDQPSYIKSPLPKYESYISALSSPYTMSKIDPNPKQNELKKLLMQYAQNQVKFSLNNYKSKTYESVASKELSEVILPKLKIYDHEIERKLRRFKTQHEESQLMGRNFSLKHGTNHKYYSNGSDSSNIHDSNIHDSNKSDFYKVPKMKKLESPLHQLANKQQHSRYKHGYKFTVPPNNIFSKNYQQIDFSPNNYKVTDMKQKQLNLHSNQHANLHSNQHLNPESLIEEEPEVKRSKIKRKSPIFYMKNTEQDLESQYQRSYSNKKLPHLFKEEYHKDVLTSSRIIEKQQVNLRNFHHHQFNSEKNHQFNSEKKNRVESFIGSQMIEIDDKQQKNGRQNLNNHHLGTEPSRQNLKKVDYHSLGASRKQSRKYTKSERVETQFFCGKQQKFHSRQQGMKFSQYENQYAFINKRLEDIQKFNNYYTHNYINSYKRAIADRLEGKRNLNQRRQKLKYILEKQHLQNENQEEGDNSQEIIKE